MGTVIQLNDADFSNQGLPNISPYVHQDKLSYAYDFRYGNFSDFVTGADVKGWLTNTTTETTVSKLPSEISELSNNGLYIQLDQYAALSTHKSIHDYTIGSSYFSAILVCGFPSDIDPGTNTPNFLEMGNGAGASAGIPSIEGYALSLGFRARPVFGLDVSSGVTAGKLNFIALVFDGLNFKWMNKTTGFNQTVSLASLGITQMIASPAHVDPGKHVFGSNFKTNLRDDSILLGQVAFWDDYALSTTEIDQQYALMKQIYGSLI